MKVSDDYSFKTSYPRNVQKLLSIRKRMYFFNKNVRKYGKTKKIQKNNINSKNFLYFYPQKIYKTHHNGR